MITATRFKNVKKIDLNGVELKEAFLDSPLNAVIEKANVKNSFTNEYIPNTQVVYDSKTNQNFGVVSEGYGIIQNDVVFSLFETISSELKLEPQSLNIVNGGEEYMYTAGVVSKLRYDKKEEDVIKQIVVRNSHNGRIGLSVNCNVVRMVCTNGMMGLVPHKESSFYIKHGINVNERFDKIIKNITVFDRAYQKYVERVKSLSRIRADQQMVEDFLNDCVKITSAKEEVEELIIKGKGNKGKNAFDIINGYYEYLDKKSDEYNNLFGPEAGKKVKAYNWIENYSKEHSLVSA